MEQDIKEQLRPAYQELHGLYASSPKSADNTTVTDPQFWEQYHAVIFEINKITGENYDRFKMKVSKGQSVEFIQVVSYQQKLAGLISRLYGKFFSTERNPLTSEPSTQTTINQFQTQSQNVIIDLKRTIDKKITETQDPVEKNFLTKLKDKIEGVHDVTQAIKTVTLTAAEVGLGLEALIKLFS